MASLPSAILTLTWPGRKDSIFYIMSGTGCVERVYRMVLHDNATPIVQAARRVPLALQEPLREELGRIERAGIITKVTEPTDWGEPPWQKGALRYGGPRIRHNLLTHVATTGKRQLWNLAAPAGVGRD
ncbi:uncharacterized protein LOC142587522 [Dermacentor variabilis]|uniref:uncharacterized protein LOC142587522 n=1 Tax=Dermacentor variabilis TaxID=34621 RepID=UPI003F5B1C8B